MSRAVCVACRHSIDAAAKLCPYCGANPATGERVDTQALLNEVFNPRTLTTSESVMEYARQRQGVVITLSALAALIILAALHQFVTMRNANAVTDAPAVPLTEITDVANKPEEVTPQQMPDLDFQYAGRPQAMRTYVVESGAVTPPEVIAAQQQAAAAAHPPNTVTNATPVQAKPVQPNQR